MSAEEVESTTVEKSIYCLEELKNCVENLYEYRDHYFETHRIEESPNKINDVQKQLEATTIFLDKHSDEALRDNKSVFFYLRGKAFNVQPEYSKTAQEFLSKAVKLDPKLVDAWNELGECYWKNDNVKEAKNCFLGALNHQRNKVSLRNLSIILRQEAPSSKEEQLKNIESGLEHAKEAIQLDPQDGISWTVLGNAHLSYYFQISQNPKTLKLCFSAYKQAEKDPVAKNNPDLHYNRAIALKYSEEYAEALESFSKAKALDPTWTCPTIREARLIKYLESIMDLVSNKGRVKPRRLQQLLQSISDRHLGTAVTNLTKSTLQSLEVGENRGKIVIGKVVCSIQNEDIVPFTFCLVDSTASVLVTVYNLAEGKGVIIGDSVAIPEPVFNKVQFSYQGRTYQFYKIRVENPLSLVVNGKNLNRNQQAGIQMTTFKKFD